MKMRTEYKEVHQFAPLDVKQGVTLIGSCFTVSIGDRMQRCGWEARPNSAGVLYNPASIARIIMLALSEDDDYRRQSIRESISQNGDLYTSWLTDSKSTTDSIEETERRVEERLAALRDGILTSQALIVTFGTAWIYELAERPGYVVSNCHKYPSAMFVRRRLTIAEIVDMWRDVTARVEEMRPGMRFIFTVSPIRHLKDGFEGNSRSKAILQLACEEICSMCKSAEYFPSYEILCDDLRDYRFYADDLVHPSSMAVEYIWEKLCERYVTSVDQEILKRGEKERAARLHRPIIR